MFTEKECKILKAFVEGEIFNLEMEDSFLDGGSKETEGDNDYLLTLETIKYKLNAYTANDIENIFVGDGCHSC